MRVIVLLFALCLLGCSTDPYRELDSELDLVMGVIQEPKGLNCKAWGCNDEEKELLADYWANLQSWRVVATRRVAWRKITTVEVTTKSGKKGRLMVVLMPREGRIEVTFFKA